MGHDSFIHTGRDSFVHIGHAWYVRMGHDSFMYIGPGPMSIGSLRLAIRVGYNGLD